MTDSTTDTAPDRRIQELKFLLNKGMTEGLGVGHSLGVTAADLGAGHTVYTLKPNTSQVNAMMTVHGGVLATLLDTAMGSAIFTMLPDATAYTTLELKVNYIRSVAVDDGELRCEANTVHVGRRTATAEGKIHNADGKLVAHGTCTCLIQPFG